MHLERKALYNLLRMNWMRDPHIDIKPWQVEDYRQWNQNELLERLAELGIQLDPPSFVAYTESYDSPEELSDALVPEDCSPDTEDQIYLLLFELWRILTPENRCLSIFCDELDYQINLYDVGKAKGLEPIQDAIANLAVLLEEGLDQGADPVELFDSVSTACANDVESFLYDFIVEQIEEGDPSYAGELIDTFYDYVHDVKWFDFLRARVCGFQDIEGASEILQQIYEDTIDHPSLDLDLEMLSFLVQGGNHSLFITLLKRSLSTMEVESDFQDLLTICADYFNTLDFETEEKSIESMLEHREKYPENQSVNHLDPDVSKLLKMIQAKPSYPSNS